MRLHAPPPLETVLDIRVGDGAAELYHGSRLIAEARPTRLNLPQPECPTDQEVQAAGRRYHGFEQTYFPECFVCGKWRKEGDGLRIFTGPLDGVDSVAGPWIPHPGFASGDGTMPAEIIWAALDCPGAWAARPSLDRALVLGEMSACLKGSVAAGELCTLMGWQLEQQGRKHLVATALFNNRQRLIALAQATWLEIPPENFGGINV